MAQDDLAGRAEAIRVARARLRLNQADLAKRAGLDQSTVSNAEKCRARPSTYDAIERALAELEVLAS